MATRQNNNTAAQFNQPAMAQYQYLQPLIGQQLQNTMADPLQAMNYNAQLANVSAQSAGASQASTYAQSMGARGIDPSSGIFGRSLQQAGNSMRAQQNSLNNNLLLQAGNLSQSAATAATQYQPLQTGQNNGTTQTGVGSWI